MGKDTVRITLDTEILDKIIKQVSEETRAYLIHDGVEYGVHQEFGRGGHPSLVPAFDRHTKGLPEIIGQAIEKGVSLDDVLGKIAFDIMAEWKADVNVDTATYKNSIMVRPL